MQDTLLFAKQLARDAGKILADNLGHISKIDYKGRCDMVTNVDRESEEFIANQLEKRFPEHDLLAEESHHAEAKSEYRWIVDPLDGTNNYVHGIPFFVVSIALEYKNEVVLGVVFNPVSKELFWAGKGEGAYLNDDKLHVSRNAKMEECMLCTGFPYGFGDDKKRNLEYWRRFQLIAQGLRRFGAAALDLCYVAAGRLDGFWELSLHPWDVAAGLLIIREAGGRTTNLEGQPATPYESGYVVSNGLIHEEMLKVISEPVKL